MNYSLEMVLAGGLVLVGASNTLSFIGSSVSTEADKLSNTIFVTLEGIRQQQIRPKQNREIEIQEATTHIENNHSRKSDNNGL